MPILDTELKKAPESYREDIRKATALLKNEGCAAVFLFGSMVTGNVHKNSDIDIGIKGLQSKKFFRVYAELDRALSHQVDLVDFDDSGEFYELLDSLGEVVKIG